MKITKPTLLINKTVCQQNINKMTEKARKHNLIFRPHFKTHQLGEVGEWFKQEGVDRITVSSVDMAEYFASYGWKDITIAIPVNILELKRIQALSKNIRLNIIIDSDETARLLRETIPLKINYFVEIDTGYKRSGIKYTDKHKIDQIINLLHENKNIYFKGFLSHNGLNYSARSIDEIENNHASALKNLLGLKKHYSIYFKDLLVSIGDTPACSISNTFSGIDEIRPGNFVYYDWMQYKLGSCSIKEIAAIMVCPVVGKYPERNEIIIHGGAIHFSKEFILNQNGTKNFGQIANIGLPPHNPENYSFFEDTYITSISQEHGIVHCNENFIHEIKIGQLLSVYPIHSCLSMNLMKNNYIIY